MLASKITTKGQVTIPKEIRDMMGIGPSDIVTFTPVEEGKVLLTPCNRSVTSLFGLLKGKGTRTTPATLEEMEEAIGRKRREAGTAGGTS